MPPTLDVFFHPAAHGGQRLYLHHRPAAGTPERGALLYVHPWAEEMNKSRRMAALAARALAREGWVVLQLDLKGCGDSSGGFADTSWDDWVQDATAALHWLHQQHGTLPLWLWGLRSGALVCAAAARALALDVHLLFWQPVHQGRQVLQQFLRLKAASQLAHGGGKAIVDAARTELNAGRCVNIAGYELGPALAHGLEAALLTAPEAAAANARQLLWVEIDSQPAPALSPAAQAALPRWRAAGWHTTALATGGAAFWQTTEIETVPSLVDITLQALNTAAAPREHSLAATAA